MKSLVLFSLLFSLPPTVGWAQTYGTEHVMSLDDGAIGPEASLDDIAWLVGAWHGEAFGGTFEEVWTRPSAGSMVGLFKLMHDESVSIYEIQTITKEEGSLVWKVKHFNADFSAWEEKEKFVSFPLVKITPDTAFFDGLTLIKDGDNMLSYLNISEDGSLREEKLVYMPFNLREAEE